MLICGRIHVAKKVEVRVEELELLARAARSELMWPSWLNPFGLQARCLDALPDRLVLWSAELNIGWTHKNTNSKFLANFFQSEYFLFPIQEPRFLLLPFRKYSRNKIYDKRKFTSLNVHPSLTQLFWSHAIASWSPLIVSFGHLRTGSVLVPFRPQESVLGPRSRFREERSFA